MGTKRCLQGLNGTCHSEDLGIGGKIILKWIMGNYGGKSMDWIHLAQDRDQQQALVKITNLQLP
jgi:hypothetical protein